MNPFGPSFQTPEPDKAGRKERITKTADWLGAQHVTDAPDPSAKEAYEFHFTKKRDNEADTLAKSYAKVILDTIAAGAKPFCGVYDKDLIARIKKELGPEIAPTVYFEWDGVPSPKETKPAL